MRHCHYCEHLAEYSTVTADGAVARVCGAHLVAAHTLALSALFAFYESEHLYSRYCVRCGAARTAYVASRAVVDQGHVFLCNRCCMITLTPPHVFCGNCGMRRSVTGMCTYCEREATL